MDERTIRFELDEDGKAELQPVKSRGKRASEGRKEQGKEGEGERKEKEGKKKKAGKKKGPGKGRRHRVYA